MNPVERKRLEAALVRMALRDLRDYLADIADASPQAVAGAVRDFYPDLVEKYGEATAALAADHFESATGLPATLVRAIDVGRTQADLGYALAPLFSGVGDLDGRLAGLLDRLVKQAGRSTMFASVGDNGLRYARVPWGDTCAFCLMLASRGDVYHTRESAGGDGNRFHPVCDCSIEPVRYDEDLEALKQAAGYDPDALYDRYLAARKEAGSGDTKEILSALREREGIN